LSRERTARSAAPLRRRPSGNRHPGRLPESLFREHRITREKKPSGGGGPDRCPVPSRRKQVSFRAARSALDRSSWDRRLHLTLRGANCLQVSLESPLKLPRLRVSNESFASRIGDSLPDQVDALAALEKVRNGLADVCCPLFSAHGTASAGEKRSGRSSRIGRDPQLPGRYPDPERLAAIYPRSYAHLNWCLSILRLLIFDSSVVRGKPSFPAAPDGPEIRPPLSSSAASMISLS
jgi:hypothetical protein